MPDRAQREQLERTQPSPPETLALDESQDTTRVQAYTLTGVPNLDVALGSGLPRGALVLFLGVPGSGKTTVASQIAFAAAHRGETVLILTALSESTGKLIEHLRGFSFYDQALIGGRVQFLSLQSILPNGLLAARDAVLRMTRQIKASILVIDGFRGMRDVEEKPSVARQFLYDIGAALGALGITTLVTSETDPRDPAFYPETTTSDVILGLHYSLIGGRQQRAIEVIKARGVAPLPGLHAMTLSAEGAHVYPHLEERIATMLVGGEPQTQGAQHPRRYALTSAELKTYLSSAERRLSFGLPELDALLQGGIPYGTSTVVAGSLGAGKTLLALHFALAGIRAGESVVYFSFRETPLELARAAAPFAFSGEFAQELQTSSALSMLWAPPIRLQPDVIADQLLNELDHRHPTRLIIDSIAELERAVLRSGDADRLEDYFAALLLAIHQREITALMTHETNYGVGSIYDFAANPLAVMAENVVLLQQMLSDDRTQLRRMLSVLKMRYSAHETALREFIIAPPDGIRVLTPLESDTAAFDDMRRASAVKPDAAKFQRHE